MYKLTHYQPHNDKPEVFLYALITKQLNLTVFNFKIAFR